MAVGSKIIGTGIAHPSYQMHNEEFEAFLETSDEWIQSRTGISTRRIANQKKGESTLSLCETSAKQALEMAKLDPKEIDAIVVGTVSPESVMPSTANLLEDKIGATNAFGFDLQAACSGFLYGLSVGDLFIRSGKHKNVLVIGAETLSTVTNFKDRGTAVLFGDGAGAVVLQATEGDSRVIDTKLYSDGRYKHLLGIPHGYAACPPYDPDYRVDHHKIHMQGREVFKLAVRNMVNAGETILKENSFTLDDIDFFIFHQANKRIIDSCMKMLKVPEEKTWINLDKYGNTSAATLPVCLHEAWQAGKVERGSLILMATFGGGLTWASGLVRL